MKTTVKSILAAAMFSITLSAQGNSPAFAEEIRLHGQTIELAYAPQNQVEDDRFDFFDSEEEFAHELNDAWLGMPAFSSEGTIVGFVEDAYLDEFGEVTELLVSLNGQKMAVYVDGDHVELTETEVAIGLTREQIAGLEHVDGLQLVSR